MILADEPLSDATTSLLTTANHKPSQWSTQFIPKRRALLNAGRPKGILVVTDATRHKTSDEPATIDYEHLARVTRLIFGTVWQVARQDSRLSSIDRSRLKITGYVCPPCPFACDTEVYEQAGACPVCGMNLIPKYSKKTD